MTEPKRFNYQQTIVYVCLVLVVCLAFVLDNINERSDERELCEAGVDSRNVDRDQSQRIYDLALSTVPKDRSQLTSDQRDRLRAYLKAVERFRNESFEAIKPSEFCQQHVEDDNITPKEWVKAHPPKPITETQ